MPAWLSANLLTIVYLLLLGGGVVVAAALAFFAETNEPLSVTPVGPIALVAGVACFGGAGVLALRLFGLGPGLSLLAAALFALLSVAVLVALALAAPRAEERRAAPADLVGALARVTAPIEPGRVRAIATGGPGGGGASGRGVPLTLPAISRDGPLAPGCVVVVTAWRDDHAEVAPLAEEASGVRRQASGDEQR